MFAPLLALGLGATTALAQGAKGGEGHVGGSFEDGGDTVVSAMMVSVSRAPHRTRLNVTACR